MFQLELNPEIIIIFEDNDAVTKNVNQGQGPHMCHVSRTHCVNLDWLFGSVNDVNVKYVHTNQQIVDLFFGKQPPSLVRIGAGWRFCSVLFLSFSTAAHVQSSPHWFRLLKRWQREVLKNQSIKEFSHWPQCDMKRAHR